MLKRVLLCVGVSLFALAMSASVHAAPKKMRLTHQFPESHFVAQVVKQFGADVARETGGTVTVEIFPAAQAYKPKEVIKAVVSGGIESGMTTNMEWSGIIPEMDLFVVPYLMTQYEVIEKGLEGSIGEKLFEQMSSKGVQPLMWLFQTRTMVYTSNDKPLRMPSDFAGKKMRGTSKIMNKGVEALGASAVSVAGPEVYMALQRGTLDIGLTDVSAALARHYYEVQKYGTVTNNFAVTFVAFANPAFWKSLDAKEQKGIMAAARAAQKACLERSEDEAKQSIEGLKEKGMTIHVQTAEEAKAWKKATSPVVDYYIETTGALGKELVQMVRKLEK